MLEKDQHYIRINRPSSYEFVALGFFNALDIGNNPGELGNLRYFS